MEQRLTRLLLKPEQYDALNGAHLPYSGNPFATLNDVSAILYSGTGQNIDGAMTQKATTTAIEGAKTWGYVGSPSSRNLSLGTWSEANTLGTANIRNTFHSNGDIQFDNNCSYNTIGEGAGSISFGLGCSHNTIRTAARAIAFGSGCIGNVLENNAPVNTLGDNVLYSRIMGGTHHCVIGNNSKYCEIGEGCSYVGIGQNCSRVKVYKTTGTASVLFTVPDNTSDATYVNGVLVTSAAPILYSGTGQNVDGAMTQKATTDALQTSLGITPPAIRSAILGAPADAWISGELTSSPSGSLPGMKFCGPNYRYEYMNGMNDTDGTSFKWVRLLKSM